MIKEVRKIYILMAIIFIITAVTTVYADWTPNLDGAASFRGSSENPGGGGGGGDTTPCDADCQLNRDIAGKPSTSTGGNGSPKYKCYYGYDINTNTKVTVDTTDLKGNSTIGSETGIVKKAFSAGTWFGVYVEEYKKVTWSTDPTSYTYTEEKQGYKCAYTCQNYKYECDYDEDDNVIPGTCGYVKKGTEYADSWQVYRSYGETVSCPSLSNFPTKFCTNTGNSATGVKEFKTTERPTALVNDCASKARTAADTDAQGRVKNTTTKVKYYEGNNYPTIGDRLTPMVSTSTKVIKSTETPHGVNSKTYERWYSHTPKHVCLNVKTADIKYIYKDDDVNTCKTIENASDYYDVTTAVEKFAYTDSSGRLIKCDKDKTNCMTEIGQPIPYDGVSEGVDREYWRYFIPLDTKSGNAYYLEIGKDESSAHLEDIECANAIENYPVKSDYTKEVKLKDGSFFTGAYESDVQLIDLAGGCIGINDDSAYPTTTYTPVECKQVVCDKPVIKSYKDFLVPADSSKSFDGKSDNNYSHDKEAVRDTGCYFVTHIDIGVKQNFYNEVTDTASKKTNFKGYKFYYRPVDVNNPFPNPLDGFSYWYKWYQANNAEEGTVVNASDKLPEISKSFDDMTYKIVMNGTTLTTIRNTNKNTPYTNWSNMTVKGKSNFLSSISTTYPTGDRSYYNLGCGPYNKDWEECKK